jgi:hypothetical protein
MGEETGTTQPSPKAAYNRAMRAEEKANQALQELAELKNAINDLVKVLKSQPQYTAQPIQAQALRPGQMIHNIITEDDEGVTEEIICPTCGTREVRKIPTKVEVKEKPVIPDNYIPAPRSISEALQLLETLHLPDGRTIFESEKFWERIDQYAQKYRAPKAKR